MRASKIRLFTQLALGCLATVASLSPAHARHRYSDNPAVIVDRALNPKWAPIGDIAMTDTDTATGKTEEAVGTGFYVSPCYVISNAHVIFGKAKAPVAGHEYAASLRLGVGASSLTFKHTTQLKLVEYGRQDRANFKMNDWVLMKDDQCLGRLPEYGWFNPIRLTASQLQSQKVTVAGFAMDHYEGQLSTSTGVVKGTNDQRGYLRFSASAMEGQSGSPVILMIGETPRVVGIFTSHSLDPVDPSRRLFPTYTDTVANNFTNIYDVLLDPAVFQLLEADRSGFENGNLQFWN